MDLRVGIIGFGLSGRVFHAPLIDAQRGLAVSAILTSDAGRAAAAQAGYPAAAVVPDLDSFFATALDLVVVASTNDSHAPLARRAIEAGIGVVVDKPFAATSADAEQLVELAAARKAFLTVFQNRRWDGDFRTVRKLLDDGRLGDVLRFESRFERWRPQLSGGWRERSDPGLAGGLLFDLGAHLIDQALVLFGPVSAVYAELDNRRDGAAVDDDVFVALQHIGGPRSHLWASAVAAHLGPRFRVLGSTGAYLVDGLDAQEAQLKAGVTPGDPDWGRNRDGVLFDAAVPTGWPTLPGAYEQFYAQVAASLLTGAAPPVDPADAVTVLRLIEQAIVSARTDRVVTV